MATLAFTQKMRRITNLTEVRNMTVVVNETEYPALEFRVVGGVDSDQADLTFEYTFVKQTANELFVQLDFENPEMISQYSVS